MTPNPASADILDIEEDSGDTDAGVKQKREMMLKYLGKGRPSSRLQREVSVLHNARHSRTTTTRQTSLGGSSGKATARESLQQYMMPVPCMNICIIVVGTAGDVAPFIALGKKLAAQGHRVRIATHQCYQEKVQKEKDLVIGTRRSSYRKFTYKRICSVDCLS